MASCQQVAQRIGQPPALRSLIDPEQSFAEMNCGLSSGHSCQFADCRTRAFVRP